MAIFADLFVDMMSSNITVQTFISRSDEGVASYSSPQTYLSHIANKTQNVIAANGQTVVARGQAWLDTVDPISVNDLVTFPDGSVPVILAVDVASDETGPAVTRLTFQ